MSFFSWLNSKVKCYHWYDISLIKLSSGAFVLLIAKLWPPLLSLEWHWYVVIGILAGIPPLAKLFGCKSCPCQKCQCDPCECKKV